MKALKLFRNWRGLVAVLAFFLAIGAGTFFLSRSWLLAGIVVTALAASLVLWCLAWSLVDLIRARWGDRKLSQELEKAPTYLPADVQETTPAELKRKFQEAVETLRGTLGKNFLYELPWFLLIGETGSGKTTSLRNSKIKWPLGGEQQGIGGTVNCDWWFGEEAVVLDTAGRFAVHEENAPVAAVWDRFLATLKSVRPRQPINGVVVVVPADALIASDEKREDLLKESRRKAKLLHDKLADLQRQLQLVFPVYLLVTKCDKIKGFVEFFTLVDPAMQASLFGWSNSRGLDERYSPKWVDEAFASLLEDLEGLRRNLLRAGEVPENSEAIYLFPEELRRLRPVLEVYLETLLESTRYREAHRFRGIFFSSGGQDQRPLSSLIDYPAAAPRDPPPAGGAVPDSQGTFFIGAEDGGGLFERPYFVHDFYARKVFPEKGLARPRAEHAGRLEVIQRYVKVASAVLGVLFTAYLVYTIVSTSGALDDLEVGVAKAASDLTVDPFERPDGFPLAEAYRALGRYDEILENAALPYLWGGGVARRTEEQLAGLFRKGARRVVEGADWTRVHERLLGGGEGERSRSLGQLEADVRALQRFHEELRALAGEERPVSAVARFLKENFGPRGRAEQALERLAGDTGETTRYRVTLPLLAGEELSRTGRAAVEKEFKRRADPGVLLEALAGFQRLRQLASTFHEGFQAYGEKNTVTLAETLELGAAYRELAAGLRAVNEAFEKVRPPPAAAAPPGGAGEAPEIKLRNLRGQARRAGREAAEGALNEAIRDPAALGAALRGGARERPEASDAVVALLLQDLEPADRALEALEALGADAPWRLEEKERREVFAGLRRQAAAELASLGVAQDPDTGRLNVAGLGESSPTARLLGALVAWKDAIPEFPSSPASGGDASSGRRARAPEPLWRVFWETPFDARRLPDLGARLAARLEWLIREPGEVGGILAAPDSRPRLAAGLERGAKYHAQLEAAAQGAKAAGEGPASPVAPVVPGESTPVAGKLWLAGLALLAADFTRLLEELPVPEPGEAEGSGLFAFLRERLEEAAKPEQAAYLKALSDSGFETPARLLGALRSHGLEAAAAALDRHAAEDGPAEAAVLLPRRAFLPPGEYTARAAGDFWGRAAPGRRRSIYWYLYGDARQPPRQFSKAESEALDRYVRDGKERFEFVAAFGAGEENEAPGFRLYREVQESWAATEEREALLAGIEEILRDLDGTEPGGGGTYGAEVGRLIADLEKRRGEWEREPGDSFLARQRLRVLQVVGEKLRLFLAWKLREDLLAFLGRFRAGIGSRYPFKPVPECAERDEFLEFFSSRDYGVVCQGDAIQLREGKTELTLVDLLRLAGRPESAYLRRLDEDFQEPLREVHRFFFGKARNLEELRKATKAFSVLFRPEATPDAGVQLLNYYFLKVGLLDEFRFSPYSPEAARTLWADDEKGRREWNVQPVGNNTVVLELGRSERLGGQATTFDVEFTAKPPENPVGYSLELSTRHDNQLGGRVARLELQLKKTQDPWYLFRFIECFENATNEDGHILVFPEFAVKEFRAESAEPRVPTPGRLSAKLSFFEGDRPVPAPLKTLRRVAAPEPEENDSWSLRSLESE